MSVEDHPGAFSVIDEATLGCRRCGVLLRHEQADAHAAWHEVAASTLGAEEDSEGGQ